MSTDTEQQLRDLFAADAAAAPSAAGLVEGALRKARRTRRVRVAGASGLLVAAGLVSSLVLTDAGGADPEAPPAASPSGAVAGTPTTGAGPTGELPSARIGDCVVVYSPEALAETRFAIDGTVVAIGPERPLEEGLPMSVVDVTFQVHEWFRGGAGETATVQMYPPTVYTAEGLQSVYEVGSRLLVAGGASPDAELVAWSCGFTRYSDPGTAAEWAGADPDGRAGLPQPPPAPAPSGPAAESTPAPAGPTGPVPLVTD